MTSLLDNAIFGNESSNLLVGTPAADTIFGGQGADNIVGGAAADFLYGNTDADVLYGSQADDFLFGGQANDLILGGQGDDEISGDDGNDTIHGDQGADQLTGGSGADTFVVAPGTGGSSLSQADLILDFAVGEDAIQLTAGLTFADLEILTNGENTVIQDQTTAEIFVVLQGVDQETVTEDSFLFERSALPPADSPDEPPTEEPEEPDVPDSVDFEPPVLDARLANDTGGNGKDLITSDPRVIGSFSDNVGIDHLEVSLNGGDFTTVFPTFNSAGNFILARGDLEFLQEGRLTDGDYTVKLRVVDTSDLVSEVATVTYTLSTQRPPVDPPDTPPVDPPEPTPPPELPDPEVIRDAPIVVIDPPVPTPPPAIGTGTERPVLEDPGNTVAEALAIAGSSGTLTYKEQVGESDPDDFYDISVGASSNLILSLTGLSHDADLFLLDSAGNVIQSSEGAESADELITQPLEFGTYVVQVKSYDLETTNYALNITLTSNLPGITTDAPDGVVELFTAESSQLIHLEPYIDNGGTFFQGFRNDPQFAGIDGRGFSTVILDTGIDLDHPFFGSDTDGNGVADRIVFSHDFADNDTDASDVDNHGSNVSSIVASQDEFETGMAPGANIIHLKVFPDDPNSDVNVNYAIEQAMQWVARHADEYNIASVNMSLGSANYAEPVNGYLSDELLLLRLKNVIVVAAAGNDFGKNNSALGVAYPAADPSALAVSATWDEDVNTYIPNPAIFGAPIPLPILFEHSTDFSTDAYRIISFSQRDPNLTDIFAPGGLITGANANGGTVDQSGTSQAAPHIAGIAVLAQQLAVQELGRRLTFDEFRDAMIISANPVINDGDDENDSVTNTGLDYPFVSVQGLGEYILYLASIENPEPPPPPPIPVTQYNFVYLYDGGTGTSNEGYSGYTYAEPGTFTVGSLYDPFSGFNERGTNGAYFIRSEQPAPSEALLGQTYVERYIADFAIENLVNVNTAVPYYFSVGSPSGFNGIGSEYDYVQTVDAGGQRIVSDDFGQDYYAANIYDDELGEIDGPIGIML
ncbi:MAG: S8 family serine peptidase [Microcoleaceae cyanobacterium]